MSTTCKATVTISLDDYESLKDELSFQRKLIESKTICGFTKGGKFFSPTYHNLYAVFGEDALSQLHSDALEKIEKLNKQINQQSKENKELNKQLARAIGKIHSLTNSIELYKEKLSTPWYKKMFKSFIKTK